MDGEAPSVYSCVIQKARKEHKCCECRRVIKVGDRYQMFRGIWEGTAGRFKTCLPCATLRDELATAAYEGEVPPFEQLGEYAREADMEWPPC